MAGSTYLDHAATTPLLPEARAAMARALAEWANPSSPHAPGRRARAALEDARGRLKAALGWAGEVVFTSGASEAIALAIGHCRKPLSHVAPIEHDAVLRHASAAARLAVGPDGRVDAVGAAPGLVAIQQVNSETGVIQPLADMAETIHAAGGLLLADCAQSAGKLPLPPADIIAFSAHKIGGPVGVGALLLRDFALLHAPGGQERGYRGGTENLPGVLGMVAALEAGAGWLVAAARLRARLEDGLRAHGAEVIAAEAPRIATIGAYRRPGMAAEAQLIRLDAAGFAVSAGSACSSGAMRPSHVLAAMQVAGAGEVIRVSLGRETTESEVDAFLAAWQSMAS